MGILKDLPPLMLTKTSVLKVLGVDEKYETLKAVLESP
jgi:hypothetical protein